MTKQHCAFRPAAHQPANVYVDGRLLPLRTDLRNHSPTGFAWGYHGSGPAQLALAIPADLHGDEDALRLHQELKRHRIANIDMTQAEWIIEEASIHHWRASVDPDFVFAHVKEAP